jgi:hypothetical protein
MKKKGESKNTVKKKERKNPMIENEYFEEIEVIDPKTGEVLIQKVKVIRYKPVRQKPVGNKGLPDETIELEEIGLL